MFEAVVKLVLLNVVLRISVGPMGPMIGGFCMV